MGWLYDEEANVLIDESDGQVVDADTGDHLGYVADEADFDGEFVDPLEEAIAELQADVRDAQRDLERGRLRGQAEMSEAMAEAIEDADEADAEVEAAWDGSMEQLATKLGRPISGSQADAIANFLPEDYDDTDIERAAWMAGIDTFDDKHDLPLSERHGNVTGRSQRVDYVNSVAAELEAEELEPGGAVDEAEAGGGASAWVAGFNAGSGDPSGGGDSGLGAGRAVGDVS